ncbi:MAG: hypothetical protein J5856_03425 [Lachnospiraceae bacterium]|nr:hypothetical protein [Lachnospiraceae bacterium]
MFKNINSLKVILSAGLMLSALMLGACGSAGDNTKQKKSYLYSDLTEEDFQTVDYVNTHSNYVFALFGEMKNGTVIQDVGDLYSESSDDAKVDSYGKYIDGLDGITVTQINLSKESDYDILGVKYGDTYKGAKEKLEGAGFAFIKETNYGKNFTYTTYSKNCVNIFVSTSIEEGVALEDQVIDSITVSVHLTNPSEADSNQNMY